MYPLDLMADGITELREALALADGLKSSILPYLPYLLIEPDSPTKMPEYIFSPENTGINKNNYL